MSLRISPFCNNFPVRNISMCHRRVTYAPTRQRCCAMRHISAPQTFTRQISISFHSFINSCESNTHAHTHTLTHTHPVAFAPAPVLVVALLSRDMENAKQKKKPEGMRHAFAHTIPASIDGRWRYDDDIGREDEIHSPAEYTNQKTDTNVAADETKKKIENAAVVTASRRSSLLFRNTTIELCCGHQTAIAKMFNFQITDLLFRLFPFAIVQFHCYRRFSLAVSQKLSLVAPSHFHHKIKILILKFPLNSTYWAKSICFDCRR